MSVNLQALVTLWRERLAHLDGRQRAGAWDGWYCAIEHRVLAFFLRRHQDDAGPSSAEPLDAQSAASSEQVWIEAPAASSRRGFRSESELARIDDRLQARMRYRQRLAARASFLTLFFFFFVTFVASFYVIVSLFSAD